MKNIKSWLDRNGYKFEIRDWRIRGEIVKCIMVDNNYNGLYPTQNEINNCNKIKAYINKHHKDFKVEAVGNLTGMLISPK